MAKRDAWSPRSQIIATQRRRAREVPDPAGSGSRELQEGGLDWAVHRVQAAQRQEWPGSVRATLLGVEGP